MPDEDDADGPALAPDELDFSADRRVAELDESRYVISADDERPRVVDDADGGDAAPSAPARSDERVELGPDAVQAWLVDSLASSPYAYGFDVTATFEGNVRHQRSLSNDVVDAFETLLSWYARGTSESTPVEDVLGILLAESDLAVRYPPRSLEAALDRYDLTAEDAIADLLEAAAEDGGFTVPRENQD